jgi:hypothetical protein
LKIFARKLFALRSKKHRGREAAEIFRTEFLFFMARFESPLNNLKVASPCSQDWNAMIGDNRKRYCGDCKLNVYNLSGMSKAEAENLISTAEGRLCVRFYQRADGSVLTEDCPVGWAKVKQRTRAYVTALASLIFTFFGALGLMAALKKSDNHVVGAIPVSTATPRQTPFVMGDIAEPTPKQTPKATPQATPDVQVTVGMMVPNGRVKN